MIKLTLTEKGGEPKLLTFDKDEITIGRVSGNDIVLAKGNISKRHSRLSVRSGQIEVADLKSTNGTYVNGRKIAGPTVVASTDRIYVGDFLIGIEGPEGAGASMEDHFDSNGAGAVETESVSSAARRLPMPPPPPPPRAGGTAPHHPLDEEETAGGDDEEEMELAARPPRGRGMPIPPPPPPPRRPPTPLANRPLGGRTLDDALGDLDLAMPAPEAEAPRDEDTGSVGLFAHTRRGGEDDLDGGGSRRVPTGLRPGVVLPSATTGPAPAAAEPVASPALDALLTDPAVTQILITGPDAVLVDRGAGLALHEESLGDQNVVADALWRYANTAYPPPAPDNPVVDVRLPDGTRVSAAFPPAAPAGLVASIRKTTLPERALVDLVPGGNKDVQALFEAAIGARRNLIVTGDAGALPAALGALAAAIPPDRRVVGIGAGTKSRIGWTELAPTADLATLVRVATTLRSEHIVVAEVGGPEVAEVVLAATRGQEGLILALPARSAAEALGRIVALTGAGLAGSTTAPTLVASAFDLVVTVMAATDGSAHIVEVSEPRLEGAEVLAEVALSLHGEGTRRDPGAGRLQGRGVSARLGAAVAAAGSPLPASLVSK